MLLTNVWINVWCPFPTNGIQLNNEKEWTSQSSSTQMTLIGLSTIVWHRSLSHLPSPFTEVPRREAVCGKAASWRAGGRQQIQAGADFTGSVLHLDCSVVLWVTGLWVFYPNCEFYCMQILSPSRQHQAKDSFQPGPWVPLCHL